MRYRHEEVELQILSTQNTTNFCYGIPELLRIGTTYCILEIPYYHYPHKYTKNIVVGSKKYSIHSYLDVLIGTINRSR